MPTVCNVGIALVVASQRPLQTKVTPAGHLGLTNELYAHPIGWAAGAGTLLCLALQSAQRKYRGHTKRRWLNLTKEESTLEKDGSGWIFSAFCWIPFVFWEAMQTELWLLNSANITTVHVGRLTCWNTEEDKLRSSTDSFFCHIPSQARSSGPGFWLLFVCLLCFALFSVSWCVGMGCFVLSDFSQTCSIQTEKRQLAVMQAHLSPSRHWQFWFDSFILPWRLRDKRQ